MIELVQTKKHKIIAPLIESVSCGSVCIWISACIFSSSGIIKGSQAYSSSKVFPLLSRMRKANMVPIGLEEKKLFVVIDVRKLLKSKVNRFIKIPADITKDIEVFDKVNQEENKDKIVQNKEIYNWQLTFTSSNNGKVNTRGNNIIELYMPELQIIKNDLYINGSYARYYKALTDIELESRLKEVAREMDSVEYQYTFSALKELMHRHRLSLRFAWLLLDKLKEDNKKVLAVSIVLRALKKLIKEIVNTKKIPIRQYKDIINEHLKGIIEGNKEVYNKLSIALLFSRLRIIKDCEHTINDVINYSKTEYRLLIEGTEQILNVKYSHDYMNNIKSDKYFYLASTLNKEMCELQIKTNIPLSLKEHCYISLAKIMYLGEYDEETKSEGNEISFVSIDSRPENYETSRDELPNKVTAHCEKEIKVIDKNTKRNKRSRVCYSYRKSIQLPPLTTIVPMALNNKTSRAFLPKKCQQRSLKLDLPFPCKLKSNNGSWINLVVKNGKLKLPNVQILNQWESYINSLLKKSVILSIAEQIQYEMMFMKLLSVLCTTCNSINKCSECFEKKKKAVNEVMKSLKKTLNLRLTYPESVLSIVTLAGIILLQSNEKMLGLKEYMKAIDLYILIYGDPRGRGNVFNIWGKLLISYILQANNFKKSLGTSSLADILNAEKPNTFFKNIWKYDSLEWLVKNAPIRNVSGITCNTSLITSLLSNYDNSRLDLWTTFTSDHSLFKLKNFNSRVLLWVNNNYSELGTVNTNIETPLRNEYIVNITCGHYCSFAINIHGEVFAWGNNKFGQLGINTPEISIPTKIEGLALVKHVSCGNESAVAVTTEGKLFTWGSGDNGLLGHGNLESSFIPKEVKGLKNVKEASCGGLHMAAVTYEGEVFTWGRAEAGQLGLNKEELEDLLKKYEDYYINEPYLVNKEKFEESKIVSVTCGEAHTLGLTNKGAVYGWGFSNFGQLGLGFTSDSFEPGTGNYKSTVWVPERLTKLEGIKIEKIVAGSTFSFFVSDKKELYSCGVNDFGQTANEVMFKELEVKYKVEKPQRTTDISEPIRVSYFSNIQIKDISTGENHAAAVSNDSKAAVWIWGKLTAGKSKGEKNYQPRVVESLEGVRIEKVGCGSSHSMVLTEFNNVAKSFPLSKSKVKTDNWNLKFVTN